MSLSFSSFTDFDKFCKEVVDLESGKLEGKITGVAGDNLTRAFEPVASKALEGEVDSPVAMEGNPFFDSFKGTD